MRSESSDRSIFGETAKHPDPLCVLINAYSVQARSSPTALVFHRLDWDRTLASEDFV